MRKFKWIFALLSFFMLAGCAAKNPVVVTPTETPPPKATPVPGKAVFSGQVLNSKDNSPITNTPVRLAQIYRQGEQGAYVLDVSHSPGSFSDDKGQFVIGDIVPAEYLIVVGEPDKNNYIIYQDSAGKPFTYKLEADQSFEVGVIKVDFKP